MAYRRKKKDRKGFVATLVVLLLLITISSQTEKINETGSNIANTIFAPVEKVTYSISSTIKEQVERSLGSKETRAAVEKLEEENKALEIENAKLNTIISKKNFLEDEKNALDKSENSYMKAKVVNTDSNSMTKNFTIDKGKKDGIEKNDIILQAIGDSKYYTGLVGKVVEVYETTARVETINSMSNDVSFVNSKSGDYGVIDNFTQKTIQGYMLDVDSEVETKDVLLTSGLGGVYPEGIYIGTVSNVTMSEDALRKNITLNSPVDFSHLYRVLVLKKTDQYSVDEVIENRDYQGEIDE
ncbi:MAG: rod shape-determining protein MreC [Anaerococcus sp.]|uniref:rod shape-determining protein MreC n=1 Tax=Anaerococcus sp. TaxID=1872515 RepID=UPI002634D7B7|nr:rod shape-determining protein MreC [Anaerococcus sp.]MCI5972654.1 rod shape-determining protein MreC [Anaerococcus sp.]MDD6918600.1 rod shape-determining protein MreC [Peptoniphilaceae bacterium]MDY2928407.1 rod shape-determining protein MreC [Anaerococcus sp.]